ncbi:MAG: phospholipase D family protein [Deltaproteobacteria bacterium]|nr:phospholipase D family protein [Deltaproteobacteria bacterium]
MKILKFFLFLILMILPASCATVREDYPDPVPNFASKPGTSGPLADLESEFAQQHGSQKSGFLLLENNRESLKWRLALIDEARHSLDVQYYLWYGDDSGDLLLKRCLDAAKRGVRVRLIADGLILIGEGKTIAAIHSHPNLEVRIFNPFEQQRANRSLKSYQTLERFNYRMHNKIIVADNHITILGGRNLGNEYFGLNQKYNFHDLDVLGLGPAARQMSKIFDNFWNSTWVVPGYAYATEVPEGYLQEQEQALIRSLEQSQVLKNFVLERQSWTDLLQSLPAQLKIGTSSKVYDKLEAEVISQRMATELPEFSKTAQKELLIVNAYLIPDDHMLEEASKMVQRGVNLRIITNSLSSQDVPAVNSHYGPYRKRILEAGIDLYELRHDAAIKSEVDTPPIVSGFVGLHSKASTVDRSRAYIGSFNLDPRSRNINTEMGILIDSPELAGELAQKIEYLMQPENSWRVQLDEKGNVIWVSGDTILKRQPAQSSWQRIQDVFFKLFPKEYY